MYFTALFLTGGGGKMKDFLLMLMSMTYKQSLRHLKKSSKKNCFILGHFFTKKVVGLSHATAKAIIGPEGCAAPLNKTLGAASWNKAL